MHTHYSAPPTGRPHCTIIALDDEPSIRRTLARVLPALTNCQVLAVDTATALLAAVHMERPWAIVLDVDMPDADGHEVLASIRRRWPALPVVMFTGTADNTRTRAALLEAGATAVCPKNVENLARVLGALEASRGELRPR